MAKIVPSYTGTLRSHSLMLPACISECSGIRIFGRRIKSLAFSTDVAIIKNINADAIIATGYEAKGVKSAPYEKKGFFSFLKK